MRIKAICFDIDGTLYPNWRMYYHTAKSFARDPKLVKAYSKARKDIRIVDLEGVDKIGFAKQQAEMVAKNLRKSFSIEEIQERINQNLYKIWENSFRGIKPFNGIKELLLMLKKKGFILGTLSDFPIQNKLRYLGLGSGLFDVQLCSEDAGFLKPHSRPFEVLAKECGYKTSEILFVGNSYDKDIVGAKNAGMFAAHLSRKKVKGSIADLNFRDYAKFEEKLKKIIID